MNVVPKSYRFADVLSIVNGRNQKKVEATKGQYPIYGSGGIMGWANDYICPENTVIIGRKGSINNPIYVNRKFWNVDTAFGLVPNPNVLLPRYLFYFCVCFDFEKLNTTVTIPSLTKTNLLQIKMFLPPLEEQEKIICRLDKLCHLIELKKEQLKQLDALAKSRFIEMFGNPIANPKEWEILSLKDCISSIENGKSPICENFPRQGDAPAVLKLSAISTGSYLPHENKAMMAGTPFIATLEVHDGDLLLSRKNTYELVGMAAYVLSTPPNLQLPDLIFRLKPNPALINEIYLWHLLNNEYFRPSVQALAGGSAGSMPNIAKQRLEKLQLLLPPISLQNEFASFIEQLDKSKFSCRRMRNRIESFHAEGYITHNR